MPGQIVLIHEDDALRAAARRALHRAGFDVAEAKELGSPRSLEAAARADLILLPWTTSEGTRAVLTRLREGESTRRSRLLVLARRENLREAVRALELGADDCVNVPLDEAELIARVNAALRRPPAEIVTERLRAGPVLLDKAAHRLSIGDVAVELAPAEFRLLAFFLENQGRVFSREELLRRAWSRNVNAGPRTVDVHVRRLRLIFERFGCEQLIQTVRGFGYRFAEPSAPGRDERPLASGSRKVAEPRRALS